MVTLWLRFLHLKGIFFDSIIEKMYLIQSRLHIILLHKNGVIKMAKTAERKTAEIRVLLEPTLKKKSKKILDEIGISESEAVRIFFRNLVNRKEFPLELRIPPVSDSEQKDIESILVGRTEADKKISRTEKHRIDL